MPCNMCWPFKRSFFTRKNMAPTKSYLMICLPLILDLPISRSPTSILKPPSDSPGQPTPSPIGPQAAPYGTQRYRHVRLPSCTGRKMMANWQIVLQGWHAPPCSSRNIWKPFLALIFWFSMTSVYSNWRHTWMRSSVSPESFHLRRKTEIFQSVLASSRMNWLVLSWISSLWIDMGYVHDINKLNRQTLYENLGGFLEVHLLEETFFVKPPWAHGSWSEI